MDAVEHSRLLYLLDALRSAPGKSQQLLQMANKQTASEQYRTILARLNEVADSEKQLLEAVRQFRIELR